MIQVDNASEFHRQQARAGALGKLLVVNFFNESCYACRVLHPKLTQIAASNPDVLFMKANASDPQLHVLSAQLGIDRLPWFQLYLDSNLVTEFTASLNPEKLAMLRRSIEYHIPGRTPPPSASAADN